MEDKKNGNKQKQNVQPTKWQDENLFVPWEPNPKLASHFVPYHQYSMLRCLEKKDKRSRFKKKYDKRSEPKGFCPLPQDFSGVALNHRPISMWNMVAATPKCEISKGVRKKKVGFCFCCLCVLGGQQRGVFLCHKQSSFCCSSFTSSFLFLFLLFIWEEKSLTQKLKNWSLQKTKLKVKNHIWSKTIVY